MQADIMEQALDKDAGKKQDADTCVLDISPLVPWVFYAQGFVFDTSNNMSLEVQWDLWMSLEKGKKYEKIHSGDFDIDWGCVE